MGAIWSVKVRKIWRHLATFPCINSQRDNTHSSLLHHATFPVAARRTSQVFRHTTNTNRQIRKNFLKNYPNPWADFFPEIPFHCKLFPCMPHIIMKMYITHWPWPGNITTHLLFNHSMTNNFNFNFIFHRCVPWSGLTHTHSHSLTLAHTHTEINGTLSLGPCYTSLLLLCTTTKKVS